MRNALGLVSFALLALALGPLALLRRQEHQLGFDEPEHGPGPVAGETGS